MQALSNVKNSALRKVGFNPIERAWLSSKNVTIKSFHFNSRITREIPPIKTNCKVSDGSTVRMFPKMIVFTSTDVGDSEIIKRPSPKNPLKINPITVSSFNRER